MSAYLEITLKIAESDRQSAAAVYSKYKQPFLDSISGASSKELLLRGDDVQVLHGFDSTLSADATRLVLGSDSDFLGQGILDDQFEIWLAQLAPEPEKQLVYLPSIIK